MTRSAGRRPRRRPRPPAGGCTAPSGVARHCVLVAGVWPWSCSWRPCSCPALLFGDDHYWLALFTKLHGPGPVRPERGPDLGLHRPAEPGPGALLRPGRLRVGYSLKLQKACRRRRRAARRRGRHGHCPTSWHTADLPAVPDWIAPLINIWLALGAGRAAAGAGRRRCSACVDVPAAHQGRLLLAHHPGPGAGRLHARRQPAALHRRRRRHDRPGRAEAVRPHLRSAEPVLPDRRRAGRLLPRLRRADAAASSARC